FRRMALCSDNSNLDAYSGPYNSREMPKLKDEYSSSESETQAFNARSGEQRYGSTREGSARRDGKDFSPIIGFSIDAAPSEIPYRVRGKGILSLCSRIGWRMRLDSLGVCAGMKKYEVVVIFGRTYRGLLGM
ncbi:hypothetical protein CMV_024262, partial [Castanea mollissima]